MRPLLIALLLLGAISFSAQAQSFENATVEREEYAVYSAMISAIYAGERGSQLVISNPAGTPSFTGLKEKDIPFAIPGAPRVSPEVFEDFLLRNKTNRWLARRLDLDVKYVLVDIREIQKLDLRDLHFPWKDFSQKYPGANGFIKLSRVGLNPRMDEALVYASWTCGGLCGRGEFILLSRKDDVWKIVNQGIYIVS